jgi:hypothetical protein
VIPALGPVPRERPAAGDTHPRPEPHPRHQPPIQVHRRASTAAGLSANQGLADAKGARAEQRLAAADGRGAAALHAAWSPLRAAVSEAGKRCLANPLWAVGLLAAAGLQMCRWR